MSTKKTVKWTSPKVKLFSASPNPTWKRSITPKKLSEKAQNTKTKLRKMISGIEQHAYKDTKEMVLMFGHGIADASVLQNVLNGSLLFVYMRLLNSYKSSIEKLLGASVDMSSIQSQVIAEQVINEDFVKNTFNNASSKHATILALRLAQEITNSITDITMDVLMKLYMAAHNTQSGGATADEEAQSLYAALEKYMMSLQNEPDQRTLAAALKVAKEFPEDQKNGNLRAVIAEVEGVFDPLKYHTPKFGAPSLPSVRLSIDSDTYTCTKDTKGGSKRKTRKHVR